MHKQGRKTWSQKFNAADILCRENLPRRWSVCQQDCLREGLQLLSVHPVGPEIWGACTMLLSVRFTESPLLRCPQRIAIDVIHALTHGLQPASLCMTSPAFAVKTSSRFLRRHLDSNVLQSRRSLPHTSWGWLGAIMGWNAAGKKNPSFLSVQQLFTVAVSDSGNLRAHQGFRSLQITGVRSGFRGTNVSSFLFHCFLFFYWKHKSIK